MTSERTPEQIIGHDAYMQLVFEGYAVTRAVPDVPELVRYKHWLNGSFTKHSTGDFVRYDQAAAIIAAKDGVQKQWQDISKHYTGYENPSMGFRVLIERAEAAEAELAQIKAQEPVTNYIVSDFWAGFDKVKMMPNGRHPLYAAPVDQSAEIERLREALEFYADGINNRIARAALNSEKQP